LRSRFGRPGCQLPIDDQSWSIPGRQWSKSCRREFDRRRSKFADHRVGALDAAAVPAGRVDAVAGEQPLLRAGGSNIILNFYIILYYIIFYCALAGRVEAVAEEQPLLRAGGSNSILYYIILYYIISYHIILCYIVLWRAEWRRSPDDSLCRGNDPPIDPSIHPSIHPPIHPSIYLSIHPSIHPSIYLSMSTSTISISISMSICQRIIA
jgi:hypothetical protein